MEQSGIGIMYQLRREDERQLMEWLQDGDRLIGETLTLTVTDNRNRIDLGSVTVRIEKWNPPQALHQTSSV